MNLTVSTVDAQKSLYPTPPALAKKLVANLDFSWDKINHVLEPSAGTGNLVNAIANELSEYRRDRDIFVDMIEIDPALRGILADRFSESAVNQLYRHKETLRDVFREATDPIQKEDAQNAWLDAEAQYRGFRNVSAKVIHDDFMTFTSRKKYELILMNPPFADGDKHLLKAISMQERFGGQIRCILNAETLLNPYTNRRKFLVERLSQLNADISIESGAFRDAERQTDVDVAIIKIDIPMPVYESDILQKLKKARLEQEETEQAESTDLMESDFVKRIIKDFEMECELGCEFIRQYIAILPYMQKEWDGDGDDPIIRLAINNQNVGFGKPSVNNYIKAVRKKYWCALFQNPQFTRQLTSNLQEELYSRTREMEDYDFTLYNIRQLMAEMNVRMIEGVKETILGLFETLTAKYSFHDSSGNIHYYNGWCSNKAHKINSKVVIPVGGIFDIYSWTGDTFNVKNAYQILSDMEKALNYLDGELSAPVNLERQLRYANEAGKTKNIRLKYFDITFFKKGTMHIRFTCPELLDRFNIYCARNKSWLPPTYGYKPYEELDDEERAVVDGFHGDGSDGSGAEGYVAVMARSSYYLAPPNSQQVALPRNSGDN